MKELVFRFSSDTNTAHFIEQCDKMGVDYSTEMVPFIHVEVEDDKARDLVDAAKELGGEVGGDYA